MVPRIQITKFKFHQYPPTESQFTKFNAHQSYVPVIITVLTVCQCSYEQLVQMHPEVDDYKLYYAQVCSASEQWIV